MQTYPNPNPNPAPRGPVNSPSPQRIEQTPHAPAPALARKWTPEVIAFGFTAVPDLLLKHMGGFRLSPTELVLLIQIMRFWWDADTAPFPSKRTLATAMGCSEKNIQKVIKGLEARGFLRRLQRRKGQDRSESNIYDLEYLVSRLLGLAIALGEPQQRQYAEQDEEAPLSGYGPVNPRRRSAM